MTRSVKVALNASRDIPFNQLVLSQANVRRVKAGVSIDALAADIARRGLLQSLSVRPQRDLDGNDTGLFEVPAGGRRFRALQQLVKAKRISRAQPVPCIVRDDAEISAEEDSLAENSHREALHPLDQFRAMQALVAHGTDVETVAATFMVTPAVVRQRMKLASVAPSLLDIYAGDGMTLEQLMAFAVSDDHACQEQVWELLQSGHNRQPHTIRAKLLEQTVRASDKRVRFVGLDAYVAAGGYVLRDLFEDDDGGWLQDVALLDRMVDEKLRAQAEIVGAEGWKWIAVGVDFAYGHAFAMRELDGEEVPLSDEEEVRLAALRAEADALDNEWSGADELPDTVEARITAIDEEIAALVDRPLVFDADEIARAGVFISIDHDGSLAIERGYVRPEDEPVAQPAALAEGEGPIDDGVEAGDREALPPVISVGGPPASVTEVEEEQEDLLKPLPDRLVTELTAYRTLALRDAVANTPDVAFIAVLHAFVLATFYHYGTGETCMEMTIRGGSLGTHAPGLGDCIPARSIDLRHQQWSDRLPDEPGALWDTLGAFEAGARMALFAHCAAAGINAVWEPANRYNEARVSARAVDGRIAHSQVIARAAGLDMVAAGWSATVDNYLGRVTKARILSAVAETKGDEAASRIAGLKKPDMARAAEDLLAGSGWLAEPLRTGPAQPAPDEVLADVGADATFVTDGRGPASDEDGELAIAAE